MPARTPEDACASLAQQGVGNLRSSLRVPVRKMRMPVHSCARQGRVKRPGLEPVQCPRGFGRIPVHACARQGRVKRPGLEPVQCPRGLLKNAGASLIQQGVGNLRLSQRMPVRHRMMPVHGCARQGRVKRPELEPVQCPRGFGKMPVHLLLNTAWETCV